MRRTLDGNQFSQIAQVLRSQLTWFIPWDPGPFWQLYRTDETQYTGAHGW